MYLFSWSYCSVVLSFNDSDINVIIAYCTVVLLYCCINLAANFMFVYWMWKYVCICHAVMSIVFGVLPLFLV